MADKLIEMKAPDGQVFLVYPEDVEQRKTMGWKVVNKIEVSKEPEKSSKK